MHTSDYAKHAAPERSASCMHMHRYIHKHTHRILRNTELYKYHNAVFTVYFSKNKQPPHFSSVFLIWTLGASKRDSEIWTVVPILQETKPNKILLPPFYYYEETLYSWV